MNRIPRVFYSPAYDIRLWGIERLHPFDGCKPSRAWHLAGNRLGSRLETLRRAPLAPADRKLLQLVHSAQYLDSLKHSGAVAAVLEVGALRLVPARILDRQILLPMRWAVQGTVEAAGAAMSHGGAINLGGGYHHAHSDHGEGFCVYADIPIAVEALRAKGTLKTSDRVAIIDLDAHRGNGFEAIYSSDPRITFLDIYNFQVYPGMLNESKDRYPLVQALRAHMDDEGYLSVLTSLLAQLEQYGPFSLAFFNAGTDVLNGDPLGRLSVTARGIAERDRQVIRYLEERGIPWVMVPSGGYTEQSHQLLADTLVWACSEARD